MLDKALNLLGPDAELLTEIMAELGRKHAEFGVDDEAYYSTMGDSLLLALVELLGKSFTPEAEEAWIIVYGELTRGMIREMPKKAS